MKSNKSNTRREEEENRQNYNAFKANFAKKTSDLVSHVTNEGKKVYRFKLHIPVYLGAFQQFAENNPDIVLDNVNNINCNNLAGYNNIIEVEIKGDSVRAFEQEFGCLIDFSSTHKIAVSEEEMEKFLDEFFKNSGQLRNKPAPVIKHSQTKTNLENAAIASSVILTSAAVIDGMAVLLFSLAFTNPAFIAFAALAAAAIIVPATLLVASKLIPSDDKKHTTKLTEERRSAAENAVDANVRSN